MSDAFSGQAPGLTSPAILPEAIVPSDTAELVALTRALYVGQTGNVRVRLASGPTVTFPNMQGGAIYPIRVRQVLATGTTAGGLVGLS